MKIKKLHIYGYGHLKDKVITLGSSLHVLYGENEAGKSTILSFIETMLFGFPKRQQNELRYAPKSGGIHGGKAVFDLGANGELVIERVSGREPAETLITHNGKEMDERQLKALFHGMDRRLFQDLYSMRLDHLRKLEKLNEDDLNRFLLSAGISEHTSLFHLESSLENARGELFKPQGRKPVMNQALHELRAVSDRVEKSSQLREKYQRKTSEKHEIEEALATLAHKKQTLKMKQRCYEKALAIKPLYAEKKRHVLKCSELPEVHRFPEDGMARFERLKTQILALKGEANGIEEHLKQAKKQPPISIFFLLALGSVVLFFVGQKSAAFFALIAITALSLFLPSRFTEQKQAAEARLTTVRAQIKQYEEAVAALFRIADCNTEEEFRAKEKAWKERAQLAEKIGWIEKQIATQLPDEGERQNIFQLLEKEDPEHESALLDKKVSDIEQEETTLFKQRAQVRMELKKLEEDGDYDTLVQQLEMKKSAFRHHAKTWAVYTIALDILKKTKERYRNERLPEVARLATSFLQSFTNGSYGKIQMPLESEVFYVESASGVRYEPKELSRGTQEQLYLSLRLALAMVSSERIRFPMLLDDLLVHFDKERRKAAIHVIQKVAKSQQVLFFTCHDHITVEFSEQNVLRLTNKTV